MSSKAAVWMSSCLSNDESDLTLKHRTPPSPLAMNNNNNNNNNERSLIHNNNNGTRVEVAGPPQSHPIPVLPATISSKSSSAPSLQYLPPPPQQQQQQHPTVVPPATVPNYIHRRSLQKLNDPSYLQQLRHSSLDRVEHAWQQIRASSSSSSSLLLAVSPSSSGTTTNNHQHHQSVPPPMSHTTYFDTAVVDNHHHYGGGSITSVGDKSSSTIQNDSSSSIIGRCKGNKQSSPSEMATLRGSKRALRESNEVTAELEAHPDNHRHYYCSEVDTDVNPDFDLDTLEGTIRSTTNQRTETSNITTIRRVRTYLRGGNIGKNGHGLRIVQFQSNTNQKNKSIVTTVNESGMNQRTQQQHRRRRRRFTFKQNSTASLPVSSSSLLSGGGGGGGIDNSGDDAWMCGVCGMIFANEHVADQHEQQHIVTVVTGMEWNRRHPRTTTTMAKQTNSKNNNNNNSHDYTSTIRTASLIKNTTIAPTTMNQTHQQQQQQMMSPTKSTPQSTSILLPSTRGTTIEVENLPNTPLITMKEGRRHFRRRRRWNEINTGNDAASPNSFNAVAGMSSSPILQDVVRFSLTASPATTSTNIPSTNNNHMMTRQDRRFEDEYPDFYADLPLPSSTSVFVAQQQPHQQPHSLTTSTQKRSIPIRTNSNEVRFAADYGDHLLNINDNKNNNEQFISPAANGPHELEVDTVFRDSTMNDRGVVLADEALYDVTSRAVPMILSRQEVDAEYELSLLARDQLYYDECTKRAIARRANPSNRYRSDREDVLAKVQNKFVDAYQLMKESDGKKGVSDQYNRINKKGGKEGVSSTLMKHTESTLYVNVMVKNSVEVVRKELERLAKQRWDVSTFQHDKGLTRFERFRVYTQMNVVKLAGIALASDFTPRRIAVQLSNDLYRLLTPKLKRRGVTIEAEIEYRVGPYFVLAVNIKTIDWWKLIKSTHKDSVQRQLRWEKEKDRRSDKERGHPTKVSKSVSFFRSNFAYFQGAFNLSVFDVMERAIALLYYLHWTIYLPICWLAYYVLLGPSLRHFILTTVADEIFSYVEEKGMEMDFRVCRTEAQAAFMLSALREIRVDGQELKKKIEQSESREKGLVLGPLMGPAIAADKGPVPPIPAGFEIPDNLEYIGLELNLPVGFQRLRWALLSKRSTFVTEALYKTEARYENIVVGEWNKFPDEIGEPKLADSINPDDFIGAELEGQYLMPKSAFVSANMCYETHFILAYNEYCFCLKKRARNPDAPFGKTFLAWTQYLVINTGNDTCKMTCSVQPEFPHGTPMVSRQITSGMRAGTGELFVLCGSTIEKYADEFP